MDFMQILFWIGWVFGSIMTVVVVYFIIAWIWPARNSAARIFIEGRRKNMPVVALDDGARWIWKVAKKQAPGLLIDDEGQPIEVTPESLKWGGGVYFGAGEYFRSKTANAMVVDFITRAKAEGWGDKALVEKIKNIEELVNQKLQNNGKEQLEVPQFNQVTEMDLPPLPPAPAPENIKEGPNGEEEGPGESDAGPEPEPGQVLPG